MRSYFDNSLTEPIETINKTKEVMVLELVVWSKKENSAMLALYPFSGLDLEKEIEN